tara:strand:- start:212 stop:445 length:234 start_codon:yes stop_codon:yes gene_type:complete
MAKKKGDFIGELKEGSLKRMLKMNKSSEPLKIMELQNLLKVKDDTSTNFRGKSIRMTPLMRKRVNTAITLIRLSRKK